MRVKAIKVGDTVVMAEASYYGNCPKCGQPFELLNVRKSHWDVCHKDKVKHWVGENIFGGWRHETEADWERNIETLRTYEEVEPIFAWEDW